MFVSQRDRYGVPAALDLLHTTDRGRSWLDLLRWTLPSAPKLPMPEVPSPPGGPRILPAALAPYVDWLAAPEPDAATRE